MMNQQAVTLPTFTPCRFGNNYTLTPEFKAMRQFLLVDATPQQLRLVYEQLWSIPVEMAWGGKNRGQETIQEHYWIWRKGTARVDIEEFFTHRPNANEIFPERGGASWQ